jgi:Regulator of ribonuclease activity B
MPTFFNRFKGRDVNAGDRDLIRRMLSGGEKLATRPRETTHYLHFVDETAARRGAEGASRAGYIVELVPPGVGITDWQVEARHTILVDETAITDARGTLTAVAEGANGRYGGWDTYADAALDSMAAH